MVDNPIIESEMIFCIPDRENFFYIEKSNLYKRIEKGNKIAEFIYLRNCENKKVINIVEAKKSSPKQGTDRFENYIEDIAQKFANTFYLYISAILNRHSLSLKQIPNSLMKYDLRGVEFRFLLIIKKAKMEWLTYIQDALNISVRKMINYKIWVISTQSLTVINSDIAIRKGIITN